MVAIGIACVVAPESQVRADSPTTSPANPYNVKFAGSLTGEGTASMGGTTVSITGTVADTNGKKGSFEAKSLSIAADGRHFSGTGSAIGQKVEVSGRLDAAGNAEATLKTQRVTATFTTADGDHGRIVGFIPVPENTLPPAKRPPSTPTPPSSPGGPGGSPSDGGGNPGEGGPTPAIPGAPTQQPTPNKPSLSPRIHRD